MEIIIFVTWNVIDLFHPLEFSWFLLLLILAELSKTLGTCLVKEWMWELPIWYHIIRNVDNHIRGHVDVQGGHYQYQTFKCCIHLCPV